MKERNVKIIRIVPQALEGLLTTGKVTECVDGIPEGAKVVNSGYDADYDTFFVIVEHESFGTIAEGGAIPVFNPELVCHLQCPSCKRYDGL